MTKHSKLKKFSGEFFIFALFKDVIVCAVIAIGLGFMAMKSWGVEGEWRSFLFFGALAAAFAYFSFWSGWNLMCEAEEQTTEKRKWPNNLRFGAKN